MLPHLKSVLDHAPIACAPVGCSLICRRAQRVLSNGTDCSRCAINSSRPLLKHRWPPRGVLLQCWQSDRLVAVELLAMATQSTTLDSSSQRAGTANVELHAIITQGNS